MSPYLISFIRRTIPTVQTKQSSYVWFGSLTATENVAEVLEFKPSHNRIYGAADESVMNKVPVFKKTGQTAKPV